MPYLRIIFATKVATIVLDTCKIILPMILFFPLKKLLHFNLHTFKFLLILILFFFYVMQPVIFFLFFQFIVNGNMCDCSGKLISFKNNEFHYIDQHKMIDYYITIH